MPVFIKGSASDTLYVQFSDTPIHESVELHPDIILDVDESGTVVGIDIQSVTPSWQLNTEALKGVTGISAPTLSEGQHPLSGQPENAVNFTGRLVFVAA